MPRRQALPAASGASQPRGGRRLVVEAAIDLLESAIEVSRHDSVNWIKNDPDMDLIRDHPRFKAMIAAAEARLAQTP
jgi:hypothetical protein